MTEDGNAAVRAGASESTHAHAVDRGVRHPAPASAPPPGITGATARDGRGRAAVGSFAAGCGLGVLAAAFAVVALGSALLCAVGLVARVGTGGTATTTVDTGVLALVAVAAAALSLGLAAVVVTRCVRQRA